MQWLNESALAYCPKARDEKPGSGLFCGTKLIVGNTDGSGVFRRFGFQQFLQPPIGNYLLTNEIGNWYREDEANLLQ